MSIIGNPLIIPSGGGSGYFTVTDTTDAAGGTIRTITPTEGTAVIQSSKTVEITSNGTTTISPDTGNTALGSVTVNTNVSGGGGVTVESLSVTQNGTYTAPTGKAYSPVSVNVSGGTEQKQINFIDYDGTILHSYTKAEINAMTSESDLPSNPSHTGLTAQGWNWTLAQIKAQLTAIPDGDVWVGQMYVTSDGTTQIDIELNNPDLLSPYLKFAVNGTAVIDWGDSTPTDTVTGVSVTSAKYTPHTYASTGNYTIKISVSSGSAQFYNDYILAATTSSNSVSRRYNLAIVAVRIGNNFSIGNYAFYYCYSLKTVTIPSGITTIGNNAFGYCPSLRSVTIPSGVTSIGTYVFYYCYSLRSVIIPSLVTTIGNNIFQNCYSIPNISIPSGVTTIGNSSLYSCYSLQSVTIPSLVTTIGTDAFRYCYALYEIVFKPTTPATASNANVFGSIPTDCKMYVPYSALANYLTATNYPAPATYTYIGFATYESGVTLPTQDSTQAYNVVWYASKADATAQTNAITQGNGAEIYCRYTAV